MRADRRPALRCASGRSARAQWRTPTELHGVGRYGADAYFMFCRGAWRAVAPEDKDLARYHAWLLGTGGEGTGLARDGGSPRAGPGCVAGGGGGGAAPRQAAAAGQGEDASRGVDAGQAEPVAGVALGPPGSAAAGGGAAGRGAAGAALPGARAPASGCAGRSGWSSTPSSPRGVGRPSGPGAAEVLRLSGGATLPEPGAPGPRQVASPERARAPGPGMAAGAGASAARSPLLGSCGVVASAAAAEAGLPAGIGDSVVR